MGRWRAKKNICDKTTPVCPRPARVLALIELFERNADAYRSGHYNETQLRREFIDPFFAALGWDIENRSGFAEAYKDVIHEDSIKIGEDTKAPDYCFRIGGTRKFFVEANKPRQMLIEAQVDEDDIRTEEFSGY